MRIKYHSFNPCFIGLASATFESTLLFTLISIAFQSLFYWISLCNFHVPRILRFRFVCFNPCFIGLASATPNVEVTTSVVALFQSLFYWISLCNRTMDSVSVRGGMLFQSLFYWISLCNQGGTAQGTMEEWSFNPCFIGLASATQE